QHDFNEGETADGSSDRAHILIVARQDRRSQVLLRPTKTYLFFLRTSAGSTASGPNLLAISSSERLSRWRFLASWSKRPSWGAWAPRSPACTPVRRMGRGSTRSRRWAAIR